jgi:hypothetical protein
MGMGLIITHQAPASHTTNGVWQAVGRTAVALPVIKKFAAFPLAVDAGLKQWFTDSIPLKKRTSE